MKKVYEYARTIVGNMHIFVTEISKEKVALILWKH